MYEPEPEKFAAVFIENNTLGVCTFDEVNMQINCGQLLCFTYADR